MGATRAVWSGGTSCARDAMRHIMYIIAVRDVVMRAAFCESFDAPLCALLVGIQNLHTHTRLWIFTSFDSHIV